MEVRTVMSKNKPAELLTGPTVTLYRRDVELATVEYEDGESEQMYRYRETRFDEGEYELVLAGILPPGASGWTEDLRRIQRRALFEEADRMIAEANDFIEVTTGDEQTAWDAYRTAVRQYKMQVRQTVDAETFPETVEYPDLPEQPAA